MERIALAIAVLLCAGTAAAASQTQSSSACAPEKANSFDLNGCCYTCGKQVEGVMIIDSKVICAENFAGAGTPGVEGDKWRTDPIDRNGMCLPETVSTPDMCSMFSAECAGESVYLPRIVSDKCYQMLSSISLGEIPECSSAYQGKEADGLRLR